MTRRPRSKTAVPNRAAQTRTRAATKATSAPPGCLGWFFRFLGFALLLGVLAVGVLWLMWGRNLPNVSDLDVLEFSGQTRVYDRTGALIGTLTPSLSSGSSVNRDLLKLSEMSPYLQKAVVTSEDRRFYEHHGVDYLGIMRGLLKGILKNDLEGGSSITQQVVKNTLLADLEASFQALTERLRQGGRTDMDIEIQVLRDRLAREGVRPPEGALLEGRAGQTADELFRLPEKQPRR